MSTTPDATPDTGLPPSEVAQLVQMLSYVLEPLAQLCVARGVTIQALEEQLRHAFVQAARAALEQSGHAPARRTSRISSLTGLTRREVDRIESLTAPARPVSRSAATELFTRWMADPALRDAQGRPLELPRQGPAPSFESLALSVTRNVHPRSLLETLVGLQLVQWDHESDRVRLAADGYVPRPGGGEMLQFLAHNVGDHLRAAVHNVLDRPRPHFEQALFADELSTVSLQVVQELITQQWRTLMRELVPQLEALIDEDRRAGRAQDQSVRLGLYSWMAPMPPASPASPTPPDPTRNGQTEGEAT